ncbi:MAG: sugar ABC transporter permease [Actinomycetia bacterium]|nr:sugar ABC transporter permease [Actinomycetes bacterium]
MGNRISTFASKKTFFYALILPASIIILLVLIIPIAYSLYVSFTDLVLYKPNAQQFIGLKNYLEVLKDKYFWGSMWRTIYFVMGTVSAEIVIGILISLVLNQKFKGRTVLRGLVLLPWVIPGVVNGVMWKWIFNANYGALNAFLHQLHIIDSYQVWLQNPFIALNLIMLANVWKETPVVIIMVLAFFQTIPSQLYEAASIDGASPFSKFRWVTLPLVVPVLVTTFIIKAVWAIREFELIYIITKGGPQAGTTLVNYYIYQQTFKFLNFGYGSAIAYIVTILTAILAVIFIRRNILSSVS